MQSSEKINNIKNTKFFFLPALSTTAAGKPLFFVFTQSQIVEIFQQKEVRSTPFTPDYVAGISEHNRGLLPVIAMDALLFKGTTAKRLEPPRYRQYIVVRSAACDPQTEKNLQAILATHARLHLPKGEVTALDAQFSPCPLPDNIQHTDMLQGAYENETSCLLVLNLDKILLGQANPEPYVQSQSRQARKV